MSNLVLAFTRTGIIWFASVGVILSLTGFCLMMIWGRISKRYINKRTGHKPNLFERRANLLVWIGSILLYLYLPVSVLLIIVQVIPANINDVVISITLIIACVGGILEIWAGLIRIRIARQRKL